MRRTSGCRIIPLSNFTLFSVQVSFSIANVEPYITLQNTTWRDSLPSRVRLIAFLYHICQGNNYLTVGNAFAIGVSTVGKCIRQVTSAILRHMYRVYICLPRGEEATQNSNAWERRTRIPSIMGALDGTHISIRRPANCDGDVYFNRKSSYSINVQGYNNRYMLATNCSSCRLQETIYRSRSRFKERS